MRRLRPISRRRRQREEARPPDEGFEIAPEDDLQPFVPVESAPPDDSYADPDPAYAPAPEWAPRPPRSGPRYAVSAGMLALALLLLVAGAVGTLLNLNRLELSLPDAWPLGVLLAAVIWLGGALSRRDVASVLGASALAGAGLSALLDTQGIAAWRETMLGIVLIALGLGIVIRALLLRQRAII